MPERILIVDDCDTHHLLLAGVFERNFEVVPARNLAQAEALLDAQDFSLVLLDVDLPDGDGFSFYAKLRTKPHTQNTPVIFVTANDSAAGEIMGFSLGAEDYIVKPIEPVRLRSRVEARLKRLHEKEERDLNLQKGDLRLSVSQAKVSLLKDGQEIALSLTPVEFKLLFHFLRNENFVFSRAQLLNTVWGNATDVFERTVDMHISKLRKKIEASEFAVSAVHGTGYRLSRRMKNQA
ncbi:MAG: response regulator transcription factor [Proteobacteria bacterium]|nr:MAG: response regulator transcription factor [Pseudomonadota bacterium]